MVKKSSIQIKIGLIIGSILLAVILIIIICKCRHEHYKKNISKSDQNNNQHVSQVGKMPPLKDLPLKYRQMLHASLLGIKLDEDGKISKSEKKSNMIV